MYFSVVFLISATGMVLARSIDDTRSKRETSSTLVTVDCSTDHSREQLRATRNVTCQPFYTHVDLNPMPGQQLSPSAVFVRRCYGQADPDTVCAPKSTEIFHVHVSINSSSHQKQCGVVAVEDHTSCEIKCKQAPGSCNAKQEYIQSACGCKCKNQKELKHDCEMQKGKTWDDKNCKCTCIASSTDCTNGSGWDGDNCVCKHG